MRTVLFVPGFEESLHSRDYASLLKAIESRGYKTVFVPIQWKRKTIVDWTSQLKEIYEKYDQKNTILAGFSYGAMTAMMTASERLPSELWLFSLSPYFSEDIPYLKLWWLRNIGKQRTENFWRVSFDELYPNIGCPVKLFAGEKEMRRHPIIRKRFEDASRKFKYCEALEVPGAPHDVAYTDYILAIEQAIA